MICAPNRFDPSAASNDTERGGLVSRDRDEEDGDSDDLYS